MSSGCSTRVVNDVPVVRALGSLSLRALCSRQGNCTFYGQESVSLLTAQLNEINLARAEWVSAVNDSFLLQRCIRPETMQTFFAQVPLWRV